MLAEALTVKEAAERLRISQRSVYALVNAGVLPGRRLGPSRGKILVDAADVLSYWESSKGAARPPGPGDGEVRMASRHLRPPSPARRRA